MFAINQFAKKFDHSKTHKKFHHLVNPLRIQTLLENDKKRLNILGFFLLLLSKLFGNKLILVCFHRVH